MHVLMIIGFFRSTLADKKPSGIKQLNQLESRSDHQVVFSYKTCSYIIQIYECHTVNLP